MSVALIRTHRGLAIVLALFVVLGVLYSTTTPLFEAPDEQWHYAFVQYVATQHALPVQTTGTPAHLARQEGSQPPLYYLLAAATTFWVDTWDYPGIVWENQHYGYNVPGVVNDNKNLFIHTSVENFPYHGAALAIHLARLLSVAMGALAVLLTYLIALEIFPERKFLATAAAAVAAFVPQFVFVSSAVSNDSTIVALSAISLWLMLRLSREPSMGAIVALGVATGLAALAKVSGAGLVVLGGLVLVYALRKDWRALAVNLILFGAVVFAVAGWWYLRNAALYGELTGTTMMVRIFGSRETPLTAAQLQTQLAEVWETFWVGFGWGNIRANPAVYTVLQLVAALSGLGLVLRAVRQWSRGQHHPERSEGSHVKHRILRPPLENAGQVAQNDTLAIAVLALWVLVVFAELVNWMEMTQAPHGRLFFPALPALAPLVVVGLVELAPGRLEKWVPGAVAVALAAFAAVAPFVLIQPAYAYPATLGQAPTPTHRADITYGSQLKLLGYDVSPERVAPGGSVQLTLYWQSLATMDTDYSIGIHLLDSGSRVIGSRDSYPGHGMLPTRLWYAGQIIQDTYWVPVSADALGGSVAQVHVALYSRDDKLDLPAYDPAGQGITPIVGRLKLTGTAQPAPHAQNTMQAGFGKQIAMVGYDEASNPQGLALTLYWKRNAPVTADYSVFVHVLDTNGKIIAQQDSQPANGTNPTTLWDEGEVVADPYTLSVPERGTYRVDVGLYLPATGERLIVVDANGKEVGDHLELGRFEVGQ